MKQIVIFGAGKSSTYLIEYLIRHAAQQHWLVIVLDADLQAAKARTGDAPAARALSLDVQNADARKKHIVEADLVISLLPPALHYLVAEDCLAFGKHLLTASYVDARIEALRAKIEQKGLLFLCEMGLDPGIDHMSAMRLVHRLQHEQATITSFRSHCGGLVAPESDNNPWRYKISWNPRNVVLAGKSGAVYREQGREMHLPYEGLFDATRTVDVEGLGTLAYYPNRDSLTYIDTYQLHEAHDFVRTTLRYPEFCQGWKKIVELKLTDEQSFYDTTHLTPAGFFTEHFDRNGITATDYQQVAEQIDYLGLKDHLTAIDKGRCSAADVLQFLLETRLALQPHDRDMIVMLHEIGYEKNGIPGMLTSSLIVKGEDSVHTAMAKTVGLPLAIAAVMILTDRIRTRGLRIPAIPEIYEPVLDELETLGIRFTES